MLTKIINAGMIVGMIGLIFAITSIIKFEMLSDEYIEFLTDIDHYDNQVLDTMALLAENEMNKRALKCAELFIEIEDINGHWFLNIFDWTEDSFAPKEVLDKLNYWRETGQLPEPPNSKTDYDKGIKSV